MEIDFIRGNRDGPNRRNESYTVCRLHVPKDRFDNETALGLHPGTVALTGVEPCPAESFLQRSKKSLSPLEPAPLSAWSQKHGGLKTVPAHAAEHVHSTSPVDGSCTICRLRVPRQRMVEEVHAKLHPGYHVVTMATGYEYVQGDRTTGFDNVNERETRRLCTCY